MTFEPWKSDSILIRLEHILEKNEDSEYSKAVTFNFQDMFHLFDIISIRETTLSANQWLEKVERLEFTAETDNKSNISASQDKLNEENPKMESNLYNLSKESFQIILNPMEIRTFIVEMKWKASNVTSSSPKT